MLIIVFIIISNIGYSQGIKIFTGHIEDYSTGDFLAFVNITAGNISVFSNVDGDFKLLVPPVTQNTVDTIKISSLGYKTIRLLLDTIASTNTYQIRMEPDIYELDEVVITGKGIKIDAKTIVEKAITNLSNNTNTDEHILEAFFKQSHYFVSILSGDRKYLRYIESALLLLNQPGHLAYISIVKEVRESNDYRESPDYISNKNKYAETEQIDFEHDFLPLNYIQPYKPIKKEYFNNNSLLDPAIGNLNNNFVYRHKFKLDTITTYDNRLVYVIKILPTKKSTTIGSKFYIPIGRLYIAGDDFSILEFQYSYILNPKKINSIAGKMHQIDIQGNVLFRDIIKYKEINGKLCLSYLMREQGDRLFMAGLEGLKRGKSNFTEESGHFRIKRELVVNKFVKTGKLLGQDYLQPNYSSLFPDSYVYNKEFWDGYNILLNSDEEKKLLKDLGNGVPLEQQFIENGRRKK